MGFYTISERDLTILHWLVPGFLTIFIVIFSFIDSFVSFCFIVSLISVCAYQSVFSKIIDCWEDNDHKK